MNIDEIIQQAQTIAIPGATEGLQDVIEQAFDAVHASNMSKLDNNGNPIKRADGKVLKGKNYKDADLSFLHDYVNEKPDETPTEQTYEYGAVSSKYSLVAPNKLTAYATMVVQYMSSPGMVVVYTPKPDKGDIWTSFDGTTQDKLDKIFGGDGSFEKYLAEHVADIKSCYDTIKQLV